MNKFIRILIVTASMMGVGASAGESPWTIDLRPVLEENTTAQMYSRAYDSNYFRDRGQARCAVMDDTDPNTAETTMKMMGVAQIVAAQGEYPKPSCPPNQYFVEYGTLGFFPVMSLVGPAAIKTFDKDLYFEDYRDKVFRIHSRIAAAQIGIQFRRFQRGGDGLRIQFQMTGHTMFGLKIADRLQDPAKKSVFWEGNFDFVGCDDRKDQTQPLRVDSLAKLIEVEREMDLPGYTSCTFRSPKMTTRDLGHWDAFYKLIIPTLNEVTLVISEAMAKVSFQAYGGERFLVDRILSTEEQPNPDKIRDLEDIANQILGILKETSRRVASESQDQRLPNTVHFLRSQAPRLSQLSKQLTAKSKEKGVPFFNVFLINRKLRESFRLIDEAVDLASGRAISVGQVLQVPDAPQISAPPVRSQDPQPPRKK